MRAPPLKELAVCISLIAMAAQASQPPPAAPLDQVVCSATNIFIGTASRLRTVTSKESGLNCKADEAAYNTPNGPFITPCGRVEVDVKIERVLYPIGWKPLTSVRYQFGGGHFLVSDLKSDLEGKRHLFLSQPAYGESAGTFEPAYPWWLSEPVDHAGDVERILKACERKVMSNLALEPTHVGRLPIAAQVQR